MPSIFLSILSVGSKLQTRAVIAMLGCALMSITATAADRETPEGSSSRESREQAVRGLPFAALTNEAVAKLRPVLDDPTIFRRMPTQTVAADGEFFNCLVRYPDILVEIWQQMGVTKVETNRTGAFSFSGEDGAGTTSRNELIYGSDRLHIYYSEGFYEGGLAARKLEGRCICIVHGQSTAIDATQSGVTAYMDIFLKLDNLGADLIAKTISPLVVRTADYNYIETLKFVSQLSTAAQRDPDAVERLAGRLDGLQPDVKSRFVHISKQSALRRDRLIASHYRSQFDAAEPKSNSSIEEKPTSTPPTPTSRRPTPTSSRLPR